MHRDIRFIIYDFVPEKRECCEDTGTIENHITYIIVK